MKLKLCFSALCAAAVILLASPAAYADSYDLSLGSISIDSTASGQTVVQKGKTAVDQAPVITQKSAEATQNTLMSGRVPGIEKSAGGWLEIAGEDDAVLNTTGSPGIGSGFMASGDHVRISSGTVNAAGLSSAAGIGSCDGGSSFRYIEINGGNVTAVGGEYSAGIGGGGEYCFGRNISITGGEVTAAGNGGGAAIGGSRLGEGCTVKISKDAVVHAAMSVTSDGKYTGPCFGSGAASDADGKEIPPDYSALRKDGLVEFFDPDGKLLRSYSLDTPSGVLK